MAAEEINSKLLDIQVDILHWAIPWEEEEWNKIPDNRINQFNGEIKEAKEAFDRYVEGIHLDQRREVLKAEMGMDVGATI